MPYYQTPMIEVWIDREPISLSQHCNRADVDSFNNQQGHFRLAIEIVMDLHCIA